MAALNMSLIRRLLLFAYFTHKWYYCLTITLVRSFAMSNITVTRVGVLSIGKLIGTVNLIIGLAVGLITAIAGTISYLTNTTPTVVDGLLASLAIILSAVILYPLVMFAFGWLYGVLVAFIFNVVVGVSGGVDLTVKEESPRRK